MNGCNHIRITALDTEIEKIRKQLVAAREAREDDVFVSHVRTASVEELHALARELRALRAYRKETESEYAKLKLEKEVDPANSIGHRAAPKSFRSSDTSVRPK